MVKEEEDNISRLFLLLHLITPDVLYRFFKTVILKGEDFEKYLENKKHTIFHLHHNIPCCEKGCTIEKLKQQKVLSAEQFNLLFCETACEDKSHVKRLNGKLVQKCMCGIAPVVHVMVDVMDITLICCIIKKCENVQQSEEDRLQTIRNVRNKIVHSSNILNMSTLEFNNFWTKLEGALRGLAESVSVDYEKEINGRIYYTKRRSIYESFPIEQIKIIFQQLQDKITEKEVLYAYTLIFYDKNIHDPHNSKSKIKFLFHNSFDPIYIDSGGICEIFIDKTRVGYKDYKIACLSIFIKFIISNKIIRYG